MRQGRAQTVARALGWFSIGLGLAELLAPRLVARASGLEGRERLLQLHGARGIAGGVSILFARNPKPWIASRVAGDALDIAMLATGRHPNATAAIGVVAAITALDAYTAVSLARAPRQTFDYSSRSGFRRPAGAMRGAGAGKVRERRVEAPVGRALPAFETTTRV